MPDFDDIIDLTAAQLDKEDTEAKAKADAEATPPDPTPDPLSEVKDKVQGVEDMVSGIYDRIDKLQTQAPAVTPEKKEEEKPWVPSSWEEVKKLKEEAKEEAKAEFAQMLEADKAKAQEAAKAEEDQQQRINNYFEESYATLEKENILPKVSNIDDPNDKGKNARKELLMWAASQGSADLVASAKALHELHKEGFTFDPQTRTLKRDNYIPAGADAVISSSNRTTGANAKPILTAKEIRGGDFDSIADAFLSRT